MKIDGDQYAVERLCSGGVFFTATYFREKLVFTLSNGKK